MHQHPPNGKAGQPSVQEANPETDGAARTGAREWGWLADEQPARPDVLAARATRRAQDVSEIGMTVSRMVPLFGSDRGNLDRDPANAGDPRGAGRETWQSLYGRLACGPVHCLRASGLRACDHQSEDHHTICRFVRSLSRVEMRLETDKCSTDFCDPAKLRSRVSDGSIF